MFSFFRKKTGKPEPETAESTRTNPSETITPVAQRTVSEDDVTNTQKHVVNLLIPNTDYNQKVTVGGLIQNIMAGKKKRNKKKNNIQRAQSCREITPQKEMQNDMVRSNTELDKAYKHYEVTRSADDVSAPTEAKNIVETRNDHAEFVKALVLQKYGNKSPTEAKKQHVSLVYVSDEPNLEEKRHAESLLREIARSIDCTIDKLNSDKELMGATDSKTVDKRNRHDEEHIYETVPEKKLDSPMKSYKDNLKVELDSLIKYEEEKNEKPDESPQAKKKSNLKLPKSDNEGCSDDEKSENSKKKVIFNKHIVFDDGDRQTDEEMNSSFESISSSEESEGEYCVPDNDEMLGGEIVSRVENEKITEITNDTGQCNNEIKIKITMEDEDGEDNFRKISSDNSDSGFLDISDKNGSGDDLCTDVKMTESESETESELSETESESDEVVIEEIIEEIVEEEDEDEDEAIDTDEEVDEKTLVNQESKFQNQVAALTELADTRCGEAEKTRDLISQYRKEIEEKDLEIERLKTELASAYKESELVRQRSRSLEEELCAARSCSAGLAEQLSRKNDEALRQLRLDLEAALRRSAELESKVHTLEREREKLEQDKRLQEQRAQEALSTAESNTTKWRLAHEAARSQAAARAERMLADCEWKMRELEKRARDAERVKSELTESLEKVKSEKTQPSESQIAELQQLRGMATEQQRSVQSLTLQLQKVETREEALKLEVHRLKELLEKQDRIGREKEDRHLQTLERIESQHVKALETAKAEQLATFASTRAALERNHAERTRNALAQLRVDAEKDAKNADRKLREVTSRFENIKELLATKEAHYERAIAEANSKSDWELLQLRHLLDKADITYANNMEKANQKFEAEKEQLIEEWSTKLKELEQQTTTAQNEASKLLENTRNKLIAEKTDAINKLKEKHRLEMEEQWEQFMSDKENCLSRMKTECRQEGEEERVKREKELLEELAELRSQIQSKSTEFDTLLVKASACGRTLAVTEQELREALTREKDLREKRSEDATKIKQAERASKDQVEHLTRKCACLRKLFDDMRIRLASKERIAEQESKAKDKELIHLRAEVARLTKMLVEQSSPSLGARTRADGCETTQKNEESFLCTTAPLVSELKTNAPRRKGGTLKTPELIRKRPTLPELPSLPPENKLTAVEEQNGRRRAKSVDLPAVQVPVRIRQLQEKCEK